MYKKVKIFIHYFVINDENYSCNKQECVETGCSFPYCHQHYGPYNEVKADAVLKQLQTINSVEPYIK